MLSFDQSLRVLASSFLLTSLCASLSAQVTEFSVPTANSRPYTIVAGPDANLWFTESNGNKIGRITTAGVITEYPVPSAGAGAYGIATGPDGNIWFTERFTDKIGRLVPATGVITEFPLPTAMAQAWEIAAGAEGKLWFTEEDANQIGSITLLGSIVEDGNIGCCFPTGIAAGLGGNKWYTLEIGDFIGRISANNQVTQYAIPEKDFVQRLPWDIAPGPDGNMWFSELGGRALGTISEDGQTIIEYPVPGAFSGIAGVAAGPDGNMYFTQNDTNLVGGMTTTGELLPTFPTSDRPLSICLGPDGNMWFTVADGNKIGRLSLAQPNTKYVLSMDSGFVPTVRNAVIGDTVEWVFTGPNDHWVNDASNLGLFTTPFMSPISYFSTEFHIAGGYVVGDAFPFTRGGINVPVILPASGNVGVGFQVRWSDQTMPAGHLEDVLVQTPGSPGYVTWISSSASAVTYMPVTAGVYAFRARLRNTTTGNACFYSRPAFVTVL